MSYGRLLQISGAAALKAMAPAAVLTRGTVGGCDPLNVVIAQDDTMRCVMRGMPVDWLDGL